MEVVKEGTHTYLLRKIEYKKSLCDELTGHVRNKLWDYYLSVEYEVLKRNKLKTLVSVQLREKDEEKSLLFDITGKRPLKRQEKERAFSKKECKKFLQSMIDMIQEVDDYMLDLNCIELQPEYIYEEGNGEIQWIYFPQTYLETEKDWRDGEMENKNQNEDLQKRMESLFEWMLTQIDYKDTDAVQFMYQFYNRVRKLGFSKELLETYTQSELQEEYYDIGETDEINVNEKVRYSNNPPNDRVNDNESLSYEEFFKEKLELEQQKIENPSNKNSYLILYTGLEIISVIFTLIAVGVEGIFVFYGVKSGFTRLLFRYSIGGMLLIIIFVIGIVYSIRRIQNIKQNNEKSDIDIKDIIKKQNAKKSRIGIKDTLKRQDSKKSNIDIKDTLKGQDGKKSSTDIKDTLKGQDGKKSSTDIKDTLKRQGSKKNDIDKKDTIKEQNKVKYVKRRKQWNGAISDKFTQEKELQKGQQIIRTEAEWESEAEGTTVLNYGNTTGKEDGSTICRPMLRDMELGIVYIIKSCPFYIGSAEGVNHLQIQDKTVSREHAVILEGGYGEEEQGYILRDMDSTNGTWINGKKIKRGNQEQLKEGAIIRFAKKEYEFLIQDI